MKTEWKGGTLLAPVIMHTLVNTVSVLTAMR